MLTALGIGNFKAFAETQRLPIRPLTLIYGANSSGKSSVIHGLILARHAHETGDLDVHRTTVGGEAVDLGGFGQFIHRRDVSRRMEWAAELDTAYFSGRLAEIVAPVKRLGVSVGIGIALDDQGRPGPEAVPETYSFEILADGRNLLRMSRRPDGRLRMDRLDHEHQVFREVLKAVVETSTTTESLRPSDYEGLDEAINDLVPEIVASSGKFLPKGLPKSEAFSLAGLASLFPVSRGRRKEDLAAAVRVFIPRTVNDLIRGAVQEVSGELMRLQYLGPLRSYPPRHLAFAQHHDPNWYAGGGYAWDVVRRDAQVREQINSWLAASDRLQTPYELVLKEYVDSDDIQWELEQIYESFSKEVSWGPSEEFWSNADAQQLATKVLENSGLNRLTDLVMRDSRSNTIVSHRDVGIGVSQVLPVLVSAYASRDRIIAIEQPEIHLHPALQADLGDVFIESALGDNKNRFLIETHSEHLLLRIMRRMREANNGRLPRGIPEVRPEHVMVVFVEPDGSRSILREMPLNENGEFVKAWPGGFFEEGLKEIF